jgi:hypothetical protein
MAAGAYVFRQLMFVTGLILICVRRDPMQSRDGIERVVALEPVATTSTIELGSP